MVRGLPHDHGVDQRDVAGAVRGPHDRHGPGDADLRGGEPDVLGERVDLLKPVDAAAELIPQRDYLRPLGGEVERLAFLAEYGVAFLAYAESPKLGGEFVGVHVPAFPGGSRSCRRATGMKRPTSRNNSTVIQADIPLGPLIGTPEAASDRAAGKPAQIPPARGHDQEGQHQRQVG